MNLLRPATICLRLLAILQLLTGLLTAVPLTWLDAWHRWLGLHALPDSPVLRYALRGGALVQGAIGVLIWIIASDVIRYRPLAIATGAIYLASGPAFYLIDTRAGMPSFWCWLDTGSCLMTGAVVLTLSLGSRPVEG